MSALPSPAASVTSVPSPDSATVTAAAALSSSVMTPLPARLPAAPPERPAAARTGALPVEAAGMETVTASSVVSASARAVSVSVAAAAVVPEVGPVKVTVVPPSVTPAGGCAGSARSKSVPAAPPAKASGIPSDSPATRPRFSVSAMRAVSVALPSVALVSGVVRVTVVASSSARVSVAPAGSATPPPAAAAETVTVLSGRRRCC